MVINDFNWKIGGEAGEGIMVTGLMFSKICTRMGLHVYNYPEYPSRIRGGHNCYQVKVKDKMPVFAERKIDMLVALNKETIELHLEEMKDRGIIIADSHLKDISFRFGNIFYLPMDDLAKEAGGKITKNNVALGASFAFINVSLDLVLESVRKAFKDKGKDVINMNEKAVTLGYNYVKENFTGQFNYALSKISDTKNMVVTGNEAIAMGAIKAGLKLYAAYPMTPASSILHFLAPLSQKYKILVKHTEDEIAAILTAIGANFAGVRAMAGTSGGGFSLMSEALGMAAITETPLVLVEAMRPGPSTGMPTWTSQADLRFVMHASQGEFLRCILTPGDVSEAYQLIQLAFNIAEKYQIPVILMSDKLLSESSQSVDRLDHLDIKIERGKILKEVPEGYKRYDLTIEDGISFRALPPAKNGMQLANSDEHDEYGLVSEEAHERNSMLEKRFKRLELLKKDLPKPKIYGDEAPDVSIIGFGSIKLPALAAMNILKEKGIKVNFLHCLCPFPFVGEHYLDFINSAKILISVENNYTGQLASIIQENLCIKINHRILKDDGRPFFPDELAENILKIYKGESL